MADSFCTRFVKACEARPDKVAMRIVGADHATYTFGDFLSRVRSIARRLEQEGIEFGDRVALLGENHPSCALSYLGII